MREPTHVKARIQECCHDVRVSELRGGGHEWHGADARAAERLRVGHTEPPPVHVRACRRRACREHCERGAHARSVPLGDRQVERDRGGGGLDDVLAVRHGAHTRVWLPGLGLEQRAQRGVAAVAV